MTAYTTHKPPDKPPPGSFDGARRLVDAGNSVVAVPPDGSKHPRESWKALQDRHPTEAELRAAFGDGRNGPAVVCGAVSGHREAIDLDEGTLFEPWCVEVERRCPGLLGVLPIVRTPRDGGGYQVHYRCPDGIEGNQPLAREAKTPTADDPAPFRTLIETRGEGGITLTPYCPPECHPRRRRYELVRGDLDDFDHPPALTAEERAALLDAARTFNTWTPPRLVAGTAPRTAGLPQGDRPGDRFNAAGDLVGLLERHGWTALYTTRDGVTMWQRPGKRGREGSATFNYGGSGLFYVFSTNAAPFEPETSYRPFAAYAILEHGGDFGAAARALARSHAPPVLGPERTNGHAHPTPPPAGPPGGPGPDGGDDDPPTDRLPIDVTEIDLRDVTARAWEALVRANAPAPRLFRQGNVVCRVEHDDRGRPLLRELNSDRMCHALARAAAFFRLTGGKAPVQRAVPPPTPVVLDVLATPAPPLPAVERLTECPVFAPDGTLEVGVGYHPRSRTYCTADVAQLPPVPEAPPPADVARARALFLDELLADFPFVDRADRANALALALLPYARDLIRGATPLHGVEAPTPGSGKGLLVEAVLLPGCGVAYSNLTQRGDDAEWRKAITAVLRDGPAAVLIDNVTQHLTSGALASALTKPVWDDRILGTNGTVRLPVRCLWAVTANNPTYSTELARRTVPIRLDPKIDRPWERQQFRHKRLLAWVRAHRAELVWAGLVLVRHWLASGRPPYTERTLGSFEEWASVVGGILRAAGVEGFLANVGRFYETADVETAVWRRFVERWWEKHGGSVVGAGDLFELAQADEAMDLGTGNERSQRTRFGKALGRQRDRVIGGFRVVQDGELRRVLRWRLLDTRPTPEGVER